MDGPGGTAMGILRAGTGVDNGRMADGAEKATDIGISSNHEARSGRSGRRRHDVATMLPWTGGGSTAVRMHRPYATRPGKRAPRASVITAWSGPSGRRTGHRAATPDPEAPPGLDT